MKAGQPSTTAVWVCMARARAHGRSVPQFSDPTAATLLPDDARELVGRQREGDKPRGFRERIRWGMLEARTGMVVARTVEIDEAIRKAPHAQVVILGAGLDGRPWRMTELRDATVFEIDHPDTQRAKQERAAKLTQVAKEIRFVPVDFAVDSLDAALEGAGHDPGKPTTWIWEGVVMYLEQAAIEATLSVIEKRSATGSRLVIAYLQRALTASLVNLLVRRVGEPFVSYFDAEQMRALLARYHFTAVRDEAISTIAKGISPELGKTTRMVKHLRVVTADR